MDSTIIFGLFVQGFALHYRLMRRIDKIEDKISHVDNSIYGDTDFIHVEPNHKRECARSASDYE